MKKSVSNPRMGIIESISRPNTRLCQKTRSGFERLVFCLDCVRLHRRYNQYRLLRRPGQTKKRSLSGRREGFLTKPGVFLAASVFIFLAATGLLQAGEGRYVLDKITSPALAGNLLGDPATRPLWVWLPPSYDTSSDKRYPSIYLLHGFTGDHNQFKHSTMLNLNVGEMASALIAEGRIEEAIIVMPNAANVYGGSFYSSNKVIGDYRSYIAQDLVKYIDGKYRTIPERGQRSIAGNSMGANGALSLAMEYPSVFGAVAAMSPSADLAAPPSALDGFMKTNPETLDKPTLVHNTDELRALLRGNVSVNVFYARGAAFSPNPANPPFYVDLPLKYPEKTVVQDVWKKWLTQNMASQIERNGQNLKNTDIFIDIGVGPVTFMPEGHDIKHLLAALNKQGLDHSFVESPGDHISHLRVRTMEVLKFLANPGTYDARKKQSS
jgi:S-formylglutathione hydrolase FrmB